MSRLPLEGTVILDLTRMLPGGTGTLLLSELGAQVVKIERPGDLDATRYLQPRVGDSSSVQHQYLDRGKVMLPLDLRDDRGRQELLDRVRTADAIIDSFRPGVMDRLGLGTEVIHSVNPKIVSVSLSGYGKQGPMASWAGHDLNFIARAGLLGNGTEIPTVLAADITGGTLAALAIVSGILQSHRTGQGGAVDLALADAALIVGGLKIAQELGAAALDRPAVSPLDGTSPCYNIYRAADGGRLAVAAIEPKFWRTTVELLGRTDWVDRQNDPALRDEFQALIMTKPLAFWATLLERPDTCVTAVREITDVTADLQVEARGALTLRDSPVGPLPQVASPFHCIDPTRTEK